MDVVDVGVLREREQARVGNGLPEVALVIETDDVMALAVERTLERVVLVTEGERAVGFYDFLQLASFGIEIVEVDISGQLDVRRIIFLEARTRY